MNLLDVIENKTILAVTYSHYRGYEIGISSTKNIIREDEKEITLFIDSELCVSEEVEITKFGKWREETFFKSSIVKNIEELEERLNIIYNKIQEHIESKRKFAIDILKGTKELLSKLEDERLKTILKTGQISSDDIHRRIFYLSLILNGSTFDLNLEQGIPITYYSSNCFEVINRMGYSYLFDIWENMNNIKITTKGMILLEEEINMITNKLLEESKELQNDVLDICKKFLR